MSTGTLRRHREMLERVAKTVPDNITVFEETKVEEASHAIEAYSKVVDEENKPLEAPTGRRKK